MSCERSIGRRICELRKSYRLSQGQLAKEAGIRQAHLCLIENNKQSITINTLRKILNALDKDLAAFFLNLEREQEVVYPAGSYTSIQAANDTHEIRQLSPANGGCRLEVIQTTVQPEGDLGKPHVHRGEEFGMVLQGKGILTLEAKQYGLKKGDRFYINSELKHTVSNPSPTEELHLLTVCTPPAF